MTDRSDLAPGLALGSASGAAPGAAPGSAPGAASDAAVGVAASATSDAAAGVAASAASDAAAGAYQPAPYQPVDDTARAVTIPSAWYTDPAMLALERRAVFGRSWQPVARTADLAEPGDYVTCTVAGEPLVLVRRLDGELAGYYNVCRHRAGPVAAGKGNRKRLVCRYHGWTYQLDGRLHKAPDSDGLADWDPSEVCLPQVAVATWGPLVFCNLDPDPPPLSELMAPMQREIAAAGFGLDALVLTAERDYQVACNWKVYIDNYLEGYHVPLVHPGLYRELDFERYQSEPFAQHVTQHAPLRAQKSSGRNPVYSTADAQALYYWIFPNWMLNVYPGNMQLNVIIPIDHVRTVTVFEWYTAPDLDDQARTQLDRGIEFAHEVQREDVEICELVQHGLESRSYDTGRLVPRHEGGVHGFHRMLHDCLNQ